MTDVPMFAAPRSDPPPLSRHYAPERAARGTYSKYKPKNRVPCDECIAVLHEAGGVGPAPAGAKIGRRGITTVRLCHAHADLWKAAEGR